MTIDSLKLYIHKFLIYFNGAQDEIDILRSRIDVSDDLFDKFQAEKKSDHYQRVFDAKNPLVSVCIPTYNRGDLLIKRSLKSIINQDYENLEIIVIGDCCTDNTAELIAQISDERVNFINLPVRGKYPDEPHWRWMVAGTAAVNHALSLAKGDFITHLDDDDEHSLDRISKLVHFVQDARADIVWHPFWNERTKGRWRLRKAKQFKKNQVTTSSVFYHNWFKIIPWDINAYKFREPGDWNRFRKFNYLGAKCVRFSEPLLRHYREKNQAQQ